MLSCGEKRKYSPQNMRRIIALPVIQNKIRRFNRRRQSDELERQAQYVFVYFYVLCHHHFINFTPQRYTLSFNHFCCFYSINHHCVILDMKDIYPPFVVRHSGSQVLTFRQIHGPQFIEILIHRQTFAFATNRKILVCNCCTPIDGLWFRCCRHRLFLCFIWFYCHGII